MWVPARGAVLDYRRLMERSERHAGDEVGGYTILRVLGAGASGTVYLAQDGGGAQVALKVLHPAYAATAESRDRLLREVAAMRRVRDDAFVTVLDAEADGAEAFIVTELVDGPSLEDEVLGGGPLDVHDTLELAEKLARALHAVHAAGLVHRDVKPSNVLLAEHGPVLIDFGIAQSVQDARLTSHGFVMGTPGYLAPELLDGGQPSPAADWWGWAASLAFAVTGRAPFGVRPLEAVLGRVRAGDVDLRGAGPLTAAALERALDPDASRRATPEEVVAALREAVAQGEEHAGAPDAGLGGVAPARVGLAPTADAPGVDPDLVEREGLGPYGTGPVESRTPASAPVATRPVVRVPTGVFERPDDEDDAVTEALAVPPGPPPPAWDEIVAAGTTRVPAPGPQQAAPPEAGTQVLPGRARDGATARFAPGPAASPRSAPSPYDAAASPFSAPSPYGAAPDRPGEPDDAAHVPGADRAPWDDAGEPHDTPVHDTLVHEAPVPRARPLVLAALTLATCTAAALFPLVTAIVVVVLVALVRPVALAAEVLHARRVRRGPRRGDGAQVALAYPWYLVKGAVGMIPGLLVSASAAVAVLGTAWWLLQTNRWVPAPRTDGATEPAGGALAGPGSGVDAAVGTQNAAWAFAVVLALTALVALLVLWFGPLSAPTRSGARAVLGRVAPGPAGTAVVVSLALVVTLALVLWGVVEQPIAWWPAGGPPDLS